MTRDEALEAAVIGERVRAVDMPEGVYIDYQFNGWRINFPGGSSSGYGMKPHDETVDWEVYVKPAPTGWDMALVKPPEPVAAPKRRGRKAWQPPAEINDIDDANPHPYYAPGDPRRAIPYAERDTPIVVSVDPGFEAAVAIKSNPWADAGLTSEPKPANCWPALNKGTSQ